ncbi:MAG TPA: hypothetical protein VH092_01125 [Urbifossiella sp.]|jgi:hypothetical protein|nr:hypothetical protein [Urbifossiella sp.]
MPGKREAAPRESAGLGSFADSPEAAELKGECDKLAREAMGALAAK